MTNLDRYKKDLDTLVKAGELLEMSIQAECYPEEFKAQVKKALGDKAKDLLKALPGFAGAYGEVPVSGSGARTRGQRSNTRCIRRPRGLWVAAGERYR